MAELTQYYNFSKNLLTVIGLWPYHNTKFRTLQNSIVSFLCFSFILVQCLALCTVEITIHTLLNKLSPIIIFSGSFLKYNVQWYLIARVKSCMNSVKCHWEAEHDETLEIMKDYASRGKVYSKQFALALYSAVSVIILCHMSTCILDIVVPLNVSRLHKFPITTEYFIDEKKYFIFIIFHTYVSLMIHGTIYVATESLTIMWLLHVIGLCNIISYRLHRIVRRDLNGNSNGNIQRGLVNVIATHRTTLQFFDVVNRDFVPTYGILLLFAVTSLSINLYRISRAVTSISEIEETLICFMFVIGELCYMYYLHHIVQKMIDHADNLTTMIFHSDWYETSLTVQKMLIIMMLRCSKPLIVTFFGFYSVTVQGFSTLLQTSFSYFTVMSSMQ